MNEKDRQAFLEAEKNMNCDKFSAGWQAALEYRDAQAATVQEPVGIVGGMPGTSGFTMACFKSEDVPLGTKLYAHPPTPPDVSFNYNQWCEIGHQFGVTGVVAEKITRAVLAKHGASK